MKRTHILLAVLGTALVVVAFWLLLWQPKQDDIATAREEIQATQDQQRGLEAELARLRSVRQEAPEAEAHLAAASAIVPESSALPSLLRQLQTAADDAGLTLTSVDVGRPAEATTDAAMATEAVPGGGYTASLPVNVALEGGYFQIVDFLRRVETPEITPRGVLWDSATLAPNEYPVLSATLTGRTFAWAVLPPAPVTDAPAEDGAEGGEGAEGDQDGADEAPEAGTPAQAAGDGSVEVQP
jgi:Tfp pilus assembly protein PilO